MKTAWEDGSGNLLLASTRFGLELENNKELMGTRHIISQRRTDGCDRVSWAYHLFCTYEQVL